MGYTTEFEGSFLLDKRLKKSHLKYLQKFSETRRMKRDARKLKSVPDLVREAVKLPIGKHGAFFVGGKGMAGQEHDLSIIDYNIPPNGQPSLWCNWIPDENGKSIVWNEGDAFYCYIEWLQYLIDNFLLPWGYKLNGNVNWQGNDPIDKGAILVKENLIDVLGPITVAEIDDSIRRIRVFLCHAKEDKEEVRKLYHLLYDDEIDAWLDEENLLPGQDWQYEIKKFVRYSDIVIVCLSQKSVNKIGYVQKEIKYALDVAEEQPEGIIFIIPVKLEECTVPERLKNWQWVNLFEEQGYIRILRALELRANELSKLNSIK